MSQLSILLVDDDEVDRMSVQRIAARSEIHLHTTSTLLEARSALARHRYDCALVDLKLPDGHGLELLQFLGPTPAIVITGTDDTSEAQDALRRGPR